MPYDLNWYVDKRVAYLDIIGDFTMEELYESSERIRDEFLPLADGKMHLICDLRSRTSSPLDLKSNRDAGNIYLHHPSMGWVVFLGMNNPVLNFMVTIASRMIKTNFKAAATEEEAQKLLVALDPTLS